TDARSFVFGPDGRMFYTEASSGEIWVIDDITAGTINPTLFATVSGVVWNASLDLGLHGIALDPNFPTSPTTSTDRYMYVVAATGTIGAPKYQVIRFQEDTANLGQAVAASETTVVSAFDMGPAGLNFGGRISFDSSGLMYLSVGDGGSSVSLAGGYAQANSDRRGKILRFNKDGSIPVSNPIAGNPLYAKGFRNPRGMDFNPNTGKLFAPDMGNPATTGDDELNLVNANDNYGWDTSGESGIRSNASFVDPAWVFSTGFLPSGVEFHPSGLTNFPAIGYRDGSVYVGRESAAGEVWRIVLTGSNESAGVAAVQLLGGLASPVRDLKFNAASGKLCVLTDTSMHIVEYAGNSSADPTASAGPDQTVNEGDVVTLTAAASTDPDVGDILRYIWRQVGGSSVVTIVNAETISPTFTAPEVTFDQSFTFEVIVEDGNGGVVQDFVIITVNNISNPTDGDTVIGPEPLGEGGCTAGDSNWLILMALLALCVSAWQKKRKLRSGAGSGFTQLA
ncbi:MAG: PQQ-dependent sugar dehydrogenase, partial [Planctomycetes bacterium]|nr:PQQ-dependent sugar dehydrogenase [Planctomycetota bacterium]